MNDARCTIAALSRTGQAHGMVCDAAACSTLFHGMASSSRSYSIDVYKYISGCTVNPSGPAVRQLHQGRSPEFQE